MNRMHRLLVLPFAAAALLGSLASAHAAGSDMEGLEQRPQGGRGGRQAGARRRLHGLVRLVQAHGPGVYTRRDVRDYLADHFVAVRLNAEHTGAAQYEGKAYTERQISERFRVNGYPTTIFLHSDGKHIANVPGYVPGDRFILLLHYIGDGHMDRGEAFDDFVKQRTGGGD